MADYNITYKHIKRPWGKEIRFSATDKITGNIINEVIPFKGDRKDKEEILKIISNRIDLLSQSITEEPDVVYAKTEVETLLKEKGYLSEEQKLEDLKDLKEASTLQEQK